MPNRYVRASAIESEAVNSLSWQGEVFFRRLLNRCDDFGRYTGNLALLRAAVFPLQLDRVKESDVAKMVSECEAAGLLFKYEVDGKPLIVLNKWEQGRAKKSDYPEPPADICERMKTYVYICKHKKTYVPDSDSDSDANSDSDIGRGAGAPPTVSDADWLKSIESNPAYTGIDVQREFAKCKAWCETNRKPASRRRFINWLNRVDRPMAASGLFSEPAVRKVSAA
jgi:hypothetical protein